MKSVRSLLPLGLTLGALSLPGMAFAHNNAPTTLGSHNYAVTVLQSDLKHLGFNPGTVDGIVGQTTYTALKTFEVKAGLPVSATLNSQVTAALQKSLNNQFTPISGAIGTESLTIGNVGPAVTILQGDLIQLGYNPGPVTGVFMYQTGKALMQFQQKEGLPITEVLDTATFAKLKEVLLASGASSATTINSSTNTSPSSTLKSTKIQANPPETTNSQTKNMIVSTPNKSPNLAKTSQNSTSGSTTSQSSSSTAKTSMGYTTVGAVPQNLQVGQTINGHKIIKVLHVIATAYGPSAKDNYPYGPTDYFGQPLQPGMIAVDPSVIPLKSKMYIAGYSSPNLPSGGFQGQAMDEGGAIKGNHIDIYINQPDSIVSNFGIQNVTVYVLQ